MYRTPRGTADILTPEQGSWRYIEQKATELAHLYGYGRIDTPVFEGADLFRRTVGESTDIVQKEMYSFQDRGGDSLTLRPEGTAPICRAYLEHGMPTLPQPVRLYYFCSVFRYERPQAGRYREHHQFGIEAIGDGDPVVDTEVIHLAWQLMSVLGLHHVSLKVNSIGDSVCRPGYLKNLQEYYGVHNDKLCQDCRQRYYRNPLRLLDCKQESCQPYLQEAPRMIEQLCRPCNEHWEKLQRYVGLLDIPYTVDHRLVRGLDYYTRTVFEIQPPEEGAQSTLLGGGRYDSLIEELGGKPTPGIGFATGLERLVLNLKRQNTIVPPGNPRPVVIAYLGEAAQEAAIKLVASLRATGITAVLTPPGKSLKAQMRHASALEAPFTVILGENELQDGTAVVRDMTRGQQETVPTQEIAKRLTGIS